MTQVRIACNTIPALHIRDATSLEGMEPLLFILLCLEKGKYGITPAGNHIIKPVKSNGKLENLVIGERNRNNTDLVKLSVCFLSSSPLNPLLALY